MLSDKTELTNVLQSLLFVSGQGVEIKDIAEKLEIDEQEVIKAIGTLKEQMSGTGINLITYKQSVQLCSNPRYAEDIATVLNPIREKQLTKAAMETVAIVAYKQPVTRLDIEQIRGVSSDYALQVLMNFNLVEVVGRKDAIGKPLLFGTTNEFLKRFELESISDLPDYDELLQRIAVLHQELNSELYGSTEIIAEGDKIDTEKTENMEENGEVLGTNFDKNDSEPTKIDIEFNESETKNIIQDYTNSNNNDDDILECKEKDTL